MAKITLAGDSRQGGQSGLKPDELSGTSFPANMILAAVQLSHLPALLLFSSAVS